METEIYNWYNLKNNESNIVSNLMIEWNRLLSENHKEAVYQTFLTENANFFLSNPYTFAILSKLKLGSEYETDFVIIKDGFSNGTIYEFIEIEKPSSKLFTSKGVPSADFNAALQQIRDWKSFLCKNKHYFSKFLPTNSTRVIHNSNLKFTIIIGRREESQSVIEKRMDIAHELGIEIRSFDYLTDNVKNHIFLDRYSSDYNRMSNGNKIISPFNRAITDSEWKQICRDERINRLHLFEHFSDTIVKYLHPNKLYKEFIKEQESRHKQL